MKNNENEKWIEEVFNSMQNSQRAKPRPELFAMIEEHLDRSRAVKVIPLHQLRWAIAAAVLLLLVNVFAMRSYTTSNSYPQLVIDDNDSQPLISDFKIYE